MLYANAGIAGTGSIHEEDLASWNRMLGVHLTGVFLASRVVLKPMLAQGSGSIILQSSVAGVTGIRNLAAYTAAKGGIAALARQMAADYSERGIRTNAVCPGTVRTPLVEQTYLSYAGSPDAAAAALADRAPLAALAALRRGISLPLFVRVPGVEPRTDERVVSAIDLAPTVLDLLGLDPSPQMVGHSLGGALDAAPARDAAISAMPLATPGAKVALVDDVTRGVHEWQPITVTTADWTLLFSRWEDPVELYAAGSDEDVAGEHPEVVEALVELMLAELERGGASAADLEPRGGRPRVVAAS